MLANANRLTPYLFLAPAVAVMAVALLYPIGYMIYASFLDWNPSQRIGEADVVGLRNYATCWATRPSTKASGSRCASPPSSSPSRWCWAWAWRCCWTGSCAGMTVLRTVFILPMMIAPIVVGLMWRYMYHPTVGTFNRCSTIWACRPRPGCRTATGPSRRS